MTLLVDLDLQSYVWFSLAPEQIYHRVSSTYGSTAHPWKLVPSTLNAYILFQIAVVAHFNSNIFPCILFHSNVFVGLATHLPQAIEASHSIN